MDDPSPAQSIGNCDAGLRYLRIVRIGVRGASMCRRTQSAGKSMRRLPFGSETSGVSPIG